MKRSFATYSGLLALASTTTLPAVDSFATFSLRGPQIQREQHQLSLIGTRATLFLHHSSVPCQNSPYSRRRPFVHSSRNLKNSGRNPLYQSSVGMDSSREGDTGISLADDTGNESSLLFVDEQQRKQVQQKELTRMILNGLLLAVCFGYAAYTILNIDNGMTRGWTQGEIAMRIPLDNWLNYESSLADRPIFTKTAINVIIYLLGDWLSQTLFAKKHVLDFDAARTLRNGFIGLCFGPLVHEYYQFSDYILPVEAGMFTRLQKILMDQTIYLTVKCSIYISAVGLLQGDDIKTVQTNVQTKLPNIVLTAWKFWPLVHLVTYGVIPARHRILWVNCVDLVWNAILATMSQKKESTDVDADVDAAVTDQAFVMAESSSLLQNETSIVSLDSASTFGINATASFDLPEATMLSAEIQNGPLLSMLANTTAITESMMSLSDEASFKLQEDDYERSLVGTTRSSAIHNATAVGGTAGTP